MKARAWRFHPAAQRELDDAVDSYEQEREGIGEAFLDQIESLLEKKRLVRSPGSPVPSVDDERVRRLLLMPRFPYTVILLVDARVVLAIAHAKRRPNYWLARLRAVARAAPQR